MIGTRRQSCWTWLATALLLGWSATAWSQPAPTPVQPSQKLLDYAEIAKADIKAARLYVEAVATEITALTTRFAAYREQKARFKEAFDRDFAEAHELAAQREADRVRHWNGGVYPQWRGDGGVGMPRDGTLTVLRDQSATFDRDFVRLDSLAATAAAMNRAFREDQFQSGIDGAERDIAYALNFAVGRLWDMHLWEGAWQYQVLTLEFSGKVWSVQKYYAGEMNAIEDAEFEAELELANTGCGAATWGEGHICQDRWDAVNGEYARRLSGVCERSNDQVAPYVVDIAARLQAIAEHLKETRGRLVEDFRRVVERIEQDRSGAKTDIFAPADRFLSQSKVIATDAGFVNFTPANYLVGLYVPFAGFSRTPESRPCLRWKEQMPDNLRARFPAVTVEFWPQEVKFSLVFNQSEIARGEADARGANARP
jgi:hypothetical protein